MMRMTFREGDKEKLEDRLSEQMHKTLIDKGIEYTDAWTDGATWLLSLLGEMTDDEKANKTAILFTQAPGVIH